MSFKTIQLVLPNIIICLNGVLPEVSVFDSLLPLPIIAADGAATQLREKGILPQYIIGDLDSIAEDIDYWKNKDVQIEKVEEQNSTDFEKALNYVYQHGYLSTVICGFHGGELDHTLNNWSILMRYGRIMRLTVYDGEKIALPLYESVILPASKGEMISLIPQPHVCITTDGLEWNLRQEELRLGIREGARNCAIKETITLEIHSGTVLLIKKSSLPYIPEVKAEDAFTTRPY